MGIPGYGQWIKDTNAMDQRRTGMLQSVCSTLWSDLLRDQY
ncbi:MAG: hypothetical protein QOJ51_3685 [Acidobacteriaceae bacterium]|nr:hypothetical protein [Acidobacteriaceae bacterium]